MEQSSATLSTRTIVAFFFILTAYIILYFLVVTYQYRLDFSSFYSACQALTSGENPYQVLLTTYFPTVKKLSANLNPPAALLLFMPFSWLTYPMGVAAWSAVSFFMGIIGAGLAFYYAFSDAFYKKYRFILYLLYLSLFPVLINSAIAQLGSLLLFFIMYGYHLQNKNHDAGAAFCWGTISAIKLFPALLIFYAVSQKRYKLVWLMTLVFGVWWVLPLLLYGWEAYGQYFSMMSKVLWYGDNWNASLYGYLFRLIVDMQTTQEDILIVNCIFILLFCILMLWYFNCLKFSYHHLETAQSFGLTLAMMLLLSPLGWFYYFSLLVFPLCLTWLYAYQKYNIKLRTIWLLSFFLSTFPLDYVRTLGKVSLIGKANIYSFHFYGLVFLIYLITQSRTIKPSISVVDRNSYFVFIPQMMLAFGIVILFLSFAKHYLPAN